MSVSSQKRQEILIGNLDLGLSSLTTLQKVEGLLPKEQRDIQGLIKKLKDNRVRVAAPYGPWVERALKRLDEHQTGIFATAVLLCIEAFLLHGAIQAARQNRGRAKS